MNLTGFEKRADSIGSLLADVGKATGSTFRYITKHPKLTLGLAAGVGATGIVLRAANRARGLHQIVNESGKRDVMDYQTQLLKSIASEMRQSRMPQNQGFKQPVPITPPLR